MAGNPVSIVLPSLSLYYMNIIGCHVNNSSNLTGNHPLFFWSWNVTIIQTNEAFVLTYMTVRPSSHRQYNIKRQKRPCAYFLKRGIEKADERTQWNVVDKIKEKENKQTESSPTISTGLGTTAYSQVLSHYCLTRELLPAVFPPWAGLLLFNQPGELRLLCVHHIDAKLSVDTRST